jgi:branched-chain amino acid transport system permease protein
VTGTGDRAHGTSGSGVATLLRSLLPFVLVLGTAILLQLALRPMLNDFYSKLLLDIGTNIILAVSLTMVNGFTGQFSMGHAAFMMVGGYVAGSIVYYGGYRLFRNADVAGGLLSTMLGGREVALVTSGDLMFFGALVIGGLAAALCGYLVGLPSLRLKGDYLAIVTLGFGEIMRVLIQSQTKDVLYTPEAIAALPVYKWPLHSGGSLGFSGLPFYSSLFWAWLFAGLTLVVAYRLKASSMGRAFLSIREDEVAAGAMGIDTTKVKIRAFVLSAGLAGIAGGIFAHTVGVQLNPGELGFQKSFDIIIMVVLGGLGSISGASIAAVILTILPELLRDVAEYRMVVYALLLILIMILRPQGLLGLREVWDLWRPRGGKGGV